MAVLFIEYPKCTTCKKAKKWLDEHGVEYVDRHIVEDNPTAAELAEWHERSGLPLRRFFNTSGMKYRELGIKAKLDVGMTDEEAAQESSRCLRCDHFGYGIFRGGRNEKW